jgi:hypothetical protein
MRDAPRLTRPPAARRPELQLRVPAARAVLGRLRRRHLAACRQDSLPLRCGARGCRRRVAGFSRAPARPTPLPHASGRIASSFFRDTFSACVVDGEAVIASECDPLTTVRLAIRQAQRVSPSISRSKVCAIRTPRASELTGHHAQASPGRSGTASASRIARVRVKAANTRAWLFACGDERGAALPEGWTQETPAQDGFRMPNITDEVVWSATGACLHLTPQCAQDLMVWMRVSPSHSFTKLHR